MNPYIKKMLPVVIVFAFSPLFGMEPKKEEVNKELMPPNHPAYNPLSGNQCYVNDNTLDVCNDLERVLPAELSVKINEMSGILTDEAKEWLAGVSESNVLDFQFSPDSKLMSIRFKDNTYKLIDLETKQVLLRESNVWGYLFSPDSKELAINGIRKVIDRQTKPVMVSESNVLDFKCSCDSKLVCGVSNDGIFNVIDWDTNQVLLRALNVADYRFSPCSNLMGIKFNDDTCKVIDLQTEDIMVIESNVLCFDFSSNSNRVFIRFNDLACKVIDLQTKRELVSELNVSSCHFIPDSKRVVIKFTDDTCKVIDLEILLSLKHLTICQALYLQEFYGYMTGKKKISEKEGAKLYHTKHGLAVFRRLSESIQQQLIWLRNGRVESSKN